MTTYQKAVGIIAESLEKHHGRCPVDQAGFAVRALLENRIMPTTMRASASFFTRFHAHCRFLGTVAGDGYEYWYNKAVEHAVGQDMWPVKLVAKTISIDGHAITVDIQVPQSTTRASNAQLLVAYSVIVDGAKEKDIVLPENVEEGVS